MGTHQKDIAKRGLRRKLSTVFKTVSSRFPSGGPVAVLLAACLPCVMTLQAADPAVPAAPAASTNTTNQTNSSTLGNIKNAVEGALSGLKDAVQPKNPDADASKLLDGLAMDNFYTWIEGVGTFVDPKSIFTIKDGVLHITGEKLGYIATKKEYSDFRLVAEFKWGDHITKLTSKDKGRNSGIIVNAVGEDKEWIKGIECQIAQDRTGNIVVHGGAKVSVGTNNFAKPWTELGQPKQELEFKAGKWNTLEVISVGGRLQVLVNGKATVDAINVMPNRGKIVLQSNGAEIFFRRLDVYPISIREGSPNNTPYQWQKVTTPVNVVK